MEQVPIKTNRVIFIYLLVIAIDSISFGLIGPILAPLLAKSSVFFASIGSPFLSYCLYGLLISVFPFAFMLGAPILGSLSDYYGRKKVLTGCLILTLFGFASYAVAFIWKSITILILARLISGLSAACQGVAQAAVIDFGKQNQKPVLISTIAIGMTMGLIIGPLLASIWSYMVSWLPFVIVFGMGCCSLFLLIKFVPNDRGHFIQKKISHTDFILNPKIFRILICFLLFELGWSLFFQSLPLFVTLQWHIKNPFLGLINSYAGTMLALCLYLGARVGLRYMSLTTLILFGLCLGVIALLFLSHEIPLMIFLMTIISVVLTVGIVYPALIAQLSELTQPEQQGLLMGTTDALLAFAFMITGTLSSVLIYFNHYFPFLIAAMFWTVATMGCYQHRRLQLCNSVST